MATRIATSPDFLQYPPAMNYLMPKQDGLICNCLICCGFIIFLFFPRSCWAEEPMSGIAPLSSYIDPIIDIPHEYVSEKFVNFANDVDMFFGDEINYLESNKSVLQLDLTHVIESGGNQKPVFSGRAKLHLPGAEKKLHLLIETNPDKNLPGTTTRQQGRTSIFKEVATPDSYGAALRIEDMENNFWHLSADGGLKLEGMSIQPFVRARASSMTPVQAVELKLSESVFWFNNTGLGENTQLDADYNLSASLLFRATSSATWLHEKQNFDLRQDLSLYHTLDEHRSLLYQLSAIGVTRPQSEVSEYVALILYRQRLHRDWMFLELSPQLHYPKATDYALHSQFIVRLEVMFSK